MFYVLRAVDLSVDLNTPLTWAEDEEEEIRRGACPPHRLQFQWDTWLQPLVHLTAKEVGTDILCENSLEPITYYHFFVLTFKVSLARLFSRLNFALVKVKQNNQRNAKTKQSQLLLEFNHQIGVFPPRLELQV